VVTPDGVFAHRPGWRGDGMRRGSGHKKRWAMGRKGKTGSRGEGDSSGAAESYLELRLRLTNQSIIASD
jgi:hypothetical protein